MRARWSSVQRAGSHLQVVPLLVIFQQRVVAQVGQAAAAGAGLCGQQVGEQVVRRVRRRERGHAVAQVLQRHVAGAQRAAVHGRHARRAAAVRVERVHRAVAGGGGEEQNGFVHDHVQQSGQARRGDDAQRLLRVGAREEAACVGGKDRAARKDRLLYRLIPI